MNKNELRNIMLNYIICFIDKQAMEISISFLRSNVKNEFYASNRDLFPQGEQEFGAFFMSQLHLLVDSELVTYTNEKKTWVGLTTEGHSLCGNKAPYDKYEEDIKERKKMEIANLRSSHINNLVNIISLIGSVVFAIISYVYGLIKPSQNAVSVSSIVLGIIIGFCFSFLYRKK